MKITKNDLALALQMRSEGKSYGQIAQKLGTTRQRIRYWITNNVLKPRDNTPALERIPSKEALLKFKDAMNNLGVYTGRTERYVEMCLVLHQLRDVKDVADVFGITPQAVYHFIKNGI